MIAPKQAFQKTSHAKTHLDLVTTPGFHRAIEAALLEMQLNQIGSADASENWHQLEGAKKFIRILMDLAEPPETRRRGLPRETLTE